MNLINKKFTLLVAGLLAVVLVLLGIIFWPRAAAIAPGLEIDYLDVGQGDAELIKTPYGQKILIDGGPNNKVVQKLGEYLPFFDRDLDLVILTHPHADHVTGLVEVLKRYNVKKILLTGVIHTDPAYLEFLNLIKEKNIPAQTVKAGDVFTMNPSDGKGEGLKLEILWPIENLSGKKIAPTVTKTPVKTSCPNCSPEIVTTIDNINNTSIVAKLTFGETKFLFTGDAEEEVEKYLAENIDLASNVLKVGHHGSTTSTTEEFLRRVKPQIAVIEVGVNNEYGHPSLRILNRLERAGAKVYRTDLDGDVVIVSDGERIEVK